MLWLQTAGTIVITDHPGSTSVDSITLSLSLLVCGSQTTEPFSTVDLTREKYAASALFRAIFEVAFQEVYCSPFWWCCLPELPSRAYHSVWSQGTWPAHPLQEFSQRTRMSSRNHTEVDEFSYDDFTGLKTAYPIFLPRWQALIDLVAM